ncbi:hypothetical protein [Winogradskyella sediminis]|uniref:Uncharacterized protein n=1 Tax=Winogradskyella sediminis TaxID=1382466 RepID=A0A1H1RT98_9FLAO|nr:hypothetical protein [Winogradskyella sediminis]REG89413.1 hypothetical protein C8N41_101654 [Winogradskyella sediminis]SDS38922.1 hypothetical protein SAMN04489797_1496 [Winogradskyella sediminis]
MTLKNTINFFESLKAESSKKSEIKVYNEFIEILKKLENRTFTTDEIRSIETELERLNLKSNLENRKKHLKQALNKFKKYLKETLYLTTKGHYARLYGSLGLVFGLLFGVAILSNLERSLGISLGLIGGMVIGSIMGRGKDAQAKEFGNML